jgi:hypothetical protein
MPCALRGQIAQETMYIQHIRVQRIAPHRDPVFVLMYAKCKRACRVQHSTPPMALCAYLHTPSVMLLRLAHTVSVSVSVSVLALVDRDGAGMCRHTGVSGVQLDEFPRLSHVLRTCVTATPRHHGTGAGAQTKRTRHRSVQGNENMQRVWKDTNTSRQQRIFWNGGVFSMHTHACCQTSTTIHIAN